VLGIARRDNLVEQIGNLHELEERVELLALR
jgi:hypothetical protein